MRPSGRDERASLYFTYPSFDAPSERAGLADPTPVAIVGAGPVGMVAALTLATHGVASVLLERKDSFNDGSRAICIARQSLHILESIGAEAPFLAKALGWTTGRTFYRGRQILEFQMPDGPDRKYRPMYNLQQQYIEAFLWEAVAAEPLIDARWRSEVIGLRDEGGGAVLSVRDALGAYDLPAAHVLAADGARSALRAMRGLRLKGDNYEGRYVIADVKMAHDHPTIRRALFDPDCRRGGTVLIHRQPDDIWRIDYQLRDGESAQAAVQEDAVRASVSAVLRDIGHDGPWELEWWSVYSANTLALDDYRDGPVTFIGDAAHIVPIFGVRGLNNGLADAQNIGWKLAYALTGRAGRGLLDTYSPERRGATLDVFANAGRSTRFMTPPTRGWQVMRDAALSLALRHPYAGALANPRQMTPYVYPGGVSEGTFHGGPVPGEVIGDARWGDGFLSDRLGPGFAVLCIGAPPAGLEAALEGMAAVICAPPGSPVAAHCGAGDGAAYLIRPDLHVAGRWAAADSETIARALRAALHLEALP